MEMNADEPDWLEYFSGAVPTGEYFRMTLGDLRKALATPQDNSFSIVNLPELCFIGLISYFEAFCKDHFASMINLEPSLIFNLKRSGQDVSIDSSHVVLYGAAVDCRLGFLLAEKYDFGTPKKINALFNALLKITPLGKDDAKRYAELLRDRNLLVHHGGVFTLAYLEQQARLNSVTTDAFFNSKTIKTHEVGSAIDFLEGIAKKLLLSSQRALTQEIESRGIEYQGERKKALESIIWWSEQS